jgi:hypothetical protein
MIKHRIRNMQEGIMKVFRAILLTVFGLLAIASCTSDAEVNEMVQTAVALTEMARQTANPATNTPADTPEPVATNTATPEPTPTATRGPQLVVFSDDFSSDTGNWLGCEKCAIERDAMFMGPWGVSGADQQHFVFCRECGYAMHYRMAVDIQFHDGSASRGYGMVLFISEEYVYTVEITSFQTVALWRFEFDTGAWELLDGKWTGAVRGGELVNHVEAEVQPGTSPGRVNIFITVNGSTVLVVYNKQFDFTPVGLTIYGHAAEILFDNFEFESYEPYGPPIDPSELGGGQPQI